MQQSGPGDLGRRVAERRHELGLSREEVARRARIDLGYLTYLEEQPGASPDASTRLRLASALSVRLDQLEGAGFGEPVGTGHAPAGVAEVLELDRAGCYALIRHGGIGRVVFSVERGPVALPVNFRVLDDSIVFLTGRGSIRAAIESGGPMSVEVDRIDDTLGEGWSVLATGHAVIVEDAEGLNRIEALEIRSWAGKDRPVPVRLIVQEMTGRRIRRHL